MNEQASPRAYPRFWQAVRLMFLFLVLVTVLYVFCRIVGGVHGKSPAVYAGVQVLAYGIVLRRGLRRAGVPAREAFALRAFPSGLVIAAVLSFIGAGLLILQAGYLLARALPDPDLIRSIERDIQAGVVGVIAAVLIAPFLEELLHRGLILRGFLGAYSRRRAVVLSALLFGLAHIDPRVAVSAFVGGLLLSWLRIATGSLWPCIAGHMLWNGAIQAARLLMPYPPPKPLPELSVGEEILLVAFGGVFLGMGVLLFRRSAARRKPLPVAGAAPI